MPNILGWIMTQSNLMTVREILKRRANTRQKWTPIEIRRHIMLQVLNHAAIEVFKNISTVKY